MQQRIGAAGLAAAAGVRLSDRVADDSYVYDGRDIALRHRGGDFSEADVLHEVPHFMVAHSPK